MRAIKAMAVHNITLAVMDEAAAIDGTRPLEQIADACGFAWGSTNVQMTEDLSHFKVLLMIGKGFTPAQQVWPPLTLEAYAQLMGKRGQIKVLGRMRSICWTDHANVTRQQTIETVDIDTKHLRWVSEIMSDGSEIKSLSGRSAVLGDGTSRNPINRDELIEARSTDLKGISGMVRNFDVQQFLSEYEQTGTSIPWALPSHSWVASEETDECFTPPLRAKSTGQRGAAGGSKAGSASAAGAPRAQRRLVDHKAKGEDSVAVGGSVAGSALAADAPCSCQVDSPFGLLSRIAAQEGVKAKIKILFVVDYVAPQVKDIQTARLLRELERILPDVHVQLALSEGQIEDPDGFAAAHVDPKLATYKELKRRKALRSTFHSAMLKLGRNAGLHMPDFIAGTGQGALVDLAFANPQMLNCAMGTRNCQVEECNKIAKGWASTRAVIAIEPRLTCHGVFFRLLIDAFPEWKPERQPVASRVTVIVQDEKSPHHQSCPPLFGRPRRGRRSAGPRGRWLGQ